MPVFSPVVAPHRVQPGGLPTSARRVARLLEAGGFTVEACMGRYIDIDTSAFDADGNWYKPRYVIEHDPVFGEDGQPVLTPTGKQKMVERATDTVVEFEDALVRGTKGAMKVAARWEAREGRKWEFIDGGILDEGTSSTARLSFRALEKRIKELS